jgi:hypothetical protein
MADETHKLQKDPPEGSRKVVEHELERQSGAGKDRGAQKGENNAGSPGQQNQSGPKSGG